MATQYSCGTEQRRAWVGGREGVNTPPTINGIDYLEVASEDQRTLEIVFIHPLPGETDGVPAGPVLTTDNFVIEGGVREVGIEIVSVTPADAVLTLATDRAGDFSTYTLRLVSGVGSGEPPAGFDPMLAEVRFSFKAGCPSDFDCAPIDDCPPELLPEPEIDYLAKDFASFRRLMLDRMAVTLPRWTERNPSDVGVALVELLAYAADHLSYHQDAVATEAYLGTARRRVSVRRHARLLDYAVHDGANARAWIVVEAAPGVDGAILPGPRTLEGGDPEDTPGTLFLTRAVGLDPILGEAEAARAMREGSQPFETMEDLTLRAGWNELRFYTWGDEDCCLPKGATRAHLRNVRGEDLADLAPGTLLLFEEVRGLESGRREDADPAHRHVVRVTEVELVEDPLFPEPDPAAPGSDCSSRKCTGPRRTPCPLRSACARWRTRRTRRATGFP